MAPRRKGKQAAKPDAPEDVVPVIDALAARLAQLGRRKWKVEDLQAALEKAVGGLQDAAVKAHIAANLGQCAAQLHDRLQSLQAEGRAAQAAQEQEQEEERGAAKRAAKRSKKAAALAAAAAGADVTEAEMADAEEELSHLPLLELGSGYGQLAAAQVAGAPDARFSAAALLLSRTLPAPELVRAHVARLRPVPPPPEAGEEGGVAAAEQQLQRAGALVAAASVALGICSALSCEAATPEDALRMFAPAVSQLGEAAQLLVALQGAQAAEEAAANGAPAAAVAEQLRDLAQLASRALASMQAALAQQRAGGSAAAGGGGSYWRANPQPPSGEDAADAACSTSADVCSLLTTLRLHGGAGAGSARRQQLEALAARAAADMQLLSPYAASGQLDQLAALSEEEASGSSDAARRFLVLYGGTAKQGILGEREYLCRLAAARTAAAAARRLGEEAMAATIAGDACALPNSQEFVGWLHEQPPSGIVSAALDAASRGPDALSSHLVHDCSERGLQALLAAMRHSRAAAAAGAAAGAGEGEEGQQEDAAMDDLLFFDDRAGDATMFGRDWQVESEEDEDEEGGQELDLGELPGEEGSEGEEEGDRRRRRSVSLGGE